MVDRVKRRQNLSRFYESNETYNLLVLIPFVDIFATFKPNVVYEVRRGVSRLVSDVLETRTRLMVILNPTPSTLICNPVNKGIQVNVYNTTLPAAPLLIYSNLYFCGYCAVGRASFEF